MLSAPELATALVVVLAGATVMGLVGFGIGMVISPILLLLIEPEAVVITINGLSILLLVLVAVQTRGQPVPMRTVAPMTLAGLMAVPVGVLILSAASPGAVLRVTIAGVILALAIPSALNVRYPLTQTRLVSPVFGFVGSMLVTGLGVGVPLVALFLVTQRWSGQAIRRSIALCYLVVALGAVVVYGVTGMLTLERIWVMLSLAPAVLVGFGLASLLVNANGREGATSRRPGGNYRGQPRAAGPGDAGLTGGLWVRLMVRQAPVLSPPKGSPRAVCRPQVLSLGIAREEYKAALNPTAPPPSMITS